MKHISDSHWTKTTIAIAIILILLKVLVIDTSDTFIKYERLREGTPAKIQTIHEVNFANTIKLLGYDLAKSEENSSESIPLALYWQLAGTEIETDYAVVVTLRDYEGLIYNQQVNTLPGGLATRHWRPGYYIQDRIDLSIPPGTPPGIYTLHVSLYDPPVNRSLEILNSVGNAIGVDDTLQEINVLPPLQPVPFEMVPVDAIITVPYDLSLNPIGLNRWPETLTAGQEFELDWVWVIPGRSPLKIPMTLKWYKKNGGMSATLPIEFSKIKGLNVWPYEGTTLRSIQRVFVPGSLETGEYQVKVVWLTTQSSEIGTMRVIAPERSFELPEMQYTSEAKWQNGLRLAGYDIADDGTLTLYWQTDEPITQNLNVFVHVVNDEEIIVDQSAGVPANYTRPTTGWAVSEVIIDTVSVKYPSDMGLEVRVGWFDPITGERVKLNNGDEFVILMK